MANLKPEEYFKGSSTTIRTARIRFTETDNDDGSKALVEFPGQNDRVVYLTMDKKSKIRISTNSILNASEEKAKPGEDVASIKIDTDFPAVDSTKYIQKQLGKNYDDLLSEYPSMADDFIQNYVKNLNNNKPSYVKSISIIQTPWLPDLVPPEEVRKVEKVQSPKKNNQEGLPIEKKEEKQPAPSTTITIKPNEITAKITMTKKSGPGEIAGVLVKDVSRQGDQYGASFNDIQFTEPGDYVITITSDSPYVAPTELAIKVEPEKTVVPQENKTVVNEPIKNEGTKPNIAQIDPPTLTLPPLKYEYETMNKSIQELGEGLGFFPFLMYNGVFISHNDIISLRLYHDGIVPKCQVSFSDTLGLIKDVGIPKDDSTFEMFINSRSIHLKSIHLSFKIEKFRDSKSGAKYTMVGTLHIPGNNDFYQQVFGYYEGSSYEAIRNLSRGSGLGFNSNIDNTDDRMKWVFNGNKRYQIMEEIIKKSYISDTSFVGAYIDFYYCMNYVDVEKECKRDITSDLGVETGGITTTRDGLEESLTPLALHNELTENKSAFFFLSEPKIKHNNTLKNLVKGFRTKIKFYDNIKKRFEVHDVEGTTSDGIETTILKGKELDKENFTNNTTTRYIGKIDTENVHKNYLYAEELNRRNLDELGNIEMTIRMPNLNLNYYIYQKVLLILTNARPTVTNPSAIRYEYSGNWTIASIEIRMVSENGTRTFFQEMKLIRKELGRVPDEVANTTLETKDVDNSKQNENPLPELSNSKYKENSLYRFVDKDQREWLVQIVAQNFDGESVIAYITSYEEQKTQ